MSELMKKVYNAFYPSPLTEDVASLYVDLDDVRGSSGLVQGLANDILLSDNLTCQLVTGHRGSGKTTELRKLQHELENPADSSSKMFVVFCEIDKDVDRNDIDFPDILIAIVRQMASQLKERAGIDLKPGYFEQRWDELKSLLASEVEFENVSLQTGLLNVSSAIKSSPDTRMKVRELLEPNTNSWIAAANDVIGEAKLKLIKKGYSNLVIIVDDLDKMVLRPNEAAGCSTGENLFINRESQLSAFECHLVYTMPIALAYSHKERTISSLYNLSHIPIVPMTKIMSPDGKKYAPGFKSFQDMIDKRLTSAGAKSDDVFEDGVRDKLIELSGGQPRELMTIVRASIANGELPISISSLDKATRKFKHAYGRQLQQEHLDIIEEVKKSQSYKRNEKYDKYWMELLDSRAILQYVNSKEWYAVNPLID